MPTPFILLATQRTGSSWVQEMLDSHPELKVYNELFLPRAAGRPIWGPSDVEFLNTYLETRERPYRPLSRSYWTVRYLDVVFNGPGARVIGFKYMYNQIRLNPLVLAYAAAKRVRVIHLIRANLLDVVISAKLAEATRLYHLAGDQRPAVPWWPSKRVEATIRLEVDDMLGQLKRLSREQAVARAWLRTSRTPHHELQYERAVQTPEVFQDVLEFLGVGLPPGGLQSGLEKLRVRPQTEVIENMDEVSAALMGTPYESFLSG